MMKKKRAPKIAARRVEAWLYTVITPLIEALKIEKTFLKGKNWTWRYYTKSLEFILPLERYVDSASLPNFEDFFLAKPTIERMRKKHEDLRAALSEECRSAFEYLVALEDFQVKVTSSRSEFVEYPGGAVPEADFHKLVAQHVVNNIQDLPEYYTTSKFWAKFREQFLRYRTGENFARLDEAGKELEDDDDRILTTLMKLRVTLCQEYDVPAAPVSASSY